MSKHLLNTEGAVVCGASPREDGSNVTSNQSLVTCVDCKPTLTPAQERMLAEVREAGSKTYNGRARRVVKALEAAGLVDVVWDMKPHAKGNGIEWTESITVTPKEA